MVTPLDRQLLLRRLPFAPPQCPIPRPVVPRPRVPASYPPAPRWNPNWQIQSSFSLNDRMLRLCLPKVSKEVYELGMRPEDVALQYVQRSREVEENGGLPGLLMIHVGDVYRMLLDHISRAADEHATAILVLSVLQRDLDEDSLRLQHQTGFDFPRALRSFRAMAEVSTQTFSFWLGDLLGEFFMNNARLIVTDSGTDSLVLWAYAIWTSAMRDDDKLRCLDHIVSYRAGVVDYLRRHQYPRLHTLGRELEPILGNADDQNFDDDFDSILRGRSYRPPRRPRYSSYGPSLRRRHSGMLRPRGHVLPRHRSYSDMRDLNHQLNRVDDIVDLLTDELERTKDITSDSRRSLTRRGSYG